MGEWLKFPELVAYFAICSEITVVSEELAFLPGFYRVFFVVLTASFLLRMKKKEKEKKKNICAFRLYVAASKKYKDLFTYM